MLEATKAIAGPVSPLLMKRYPMLPLKGDAPPPRVSIESLEALK